METSLAGAIYLAPYEHFRSNSVLYCYYLHRIGIVLDLFHSSVIVVFVSFSWSQVKEIEIDVTFYTYFE